MKAASGKFHPIYQWFLFDSMESLPSNLPLPPDEVSLLVRHSLLIGSCLNARVPSALSSLTIVRA